MIELIKITKTNGKKVVSARDLYNFLGSKQDFSTWIKNRIDKYDFIEGVDYTRFHKKMDANNATCIEYVITIDMGKELSMVENNEKGKSARRYFIECEKQAKQNVSIPQSFAQALQLAADQAKQLELQAPKVESYDKFINSSSLQSFKDVANMLGLGRNTLMKRLRELKILTRKNTPYQTYLSMDLFEVKESTQHGFNVATTYITPKGIEYIKSKAI